MRMLFIFLLVTNVIFFSWQFFSTDSQSIVDITGEREAAGQETTLVLLSEVNSAAGENAPTKIEANIIEELVVEGAPLVVALTAPEVLVPQASSLPSAAPVRSCFKLGPIASGSNAKALMKIFAGLSVEARQKTVNRKEIKGYRVHMPFSVYDEAVAQVAELKKKGFKDIAIVDLKTDGYIVSLGFYKFSSSAKRRIVRLKKKGIEARLEPRYKNKPEYWVDIEVDGLGDESLWRDVDDKFAKIERQKTKCL